MVLSCSVNAVSNNTSLIEQHSQDTTHQPQKKGWWHKKYETCSDLLASYFNYSIFVTATDHERIKDNGTLHLKDLMDKNNLYQTLKVFDNKEVFDLLALLYINMLFIVDDLNHRVLQAGLSTPAWLNSYVELAHEIKDKSGLRLATTEPARKIDENTNKVLYSNLDYCFSMLKTLLKFQVSPFNPESMISDMLNKQIKCLLAKGQKSKSLLARENWTSISNLQQELLISYTASNTQGIPQYPVLASFINWCENNKNSKTSKLLNDSNQWAEKTCTSDDDKVNHSKINSEHSMFFSYLHYDEETKWHDPNDSLRYCETNDIVNNLLNSDIVISLTKDLHTVKQLVATYSDGFTALYAMNDKLSQQENFSPEEKAGKKKEKQKGKFSQVDMDEYLKEGIKQNMKDSLFWKMASGTWRIFGAIKSSFITTLTKQKQSKKVMENWLSLLYENTLKLEYENGYKGLKLVIEELILLKNEHGEEITISYAFTKIIEHRFNSAQKNKAFTILTGLQRKTDIQQKAYYYQPLVAADLDNADLSQEQSDKQADTSVSESLDAKDVIICDNKVSYNCDNKESHRDWLPMSERDYLLQRVKSHNNDNETYYSDMPSLHVDWVFIQKNTEDLNEEDETNTVWIGSNYNLSFYNKLLMGTVMMLSVVAIVNSTPLAQTYQTEKLPHNTTQLPYNLTFNSNQTTNTSHIMEAGVASSSNMIDISNVTMLNLIGRHENYPSNGDYQLTSSFDASDFIKPIPMFTGTINGRNNTITHLPHCLINILSGNGMIQNISFTNANTTNADCASVIANIMNKNSTISFVNVEDGFFSSDCKSAPQIGIAVNFMSDSSQIEHVTIADTTLTVSQAKKKIGGLVGWMRDHTTIEDINIFNVTIKASGGQGCIGIIAGSQTSHSISRDITVCNSLIEVTGGSDNVGGGYGVVKGSGIVKGLVIINTHIDMQSDNSKSGAFGMISGNADVSGIVLINTTIEIKACFQMSAFLTGRLSESGTCSHIQVIDSNLNINNTLLPNTGYLAIASGAGIMRSNDIPHARIFDLAIINSSITIAKSKDYFHGSCANQIYGNYICNMAEGVIMKSDTSNNYEITMSNSANQCSWINLPFLADDCEINKTELDAYCMHKMPTMVAHSSVDTTNLTAVSRVVSTTSVDSTTSAEMKYYRRQTIDFSVVSGTIASYVGTIAAYVGALACCGGYICKHHRAGGLCYFSKNINKSTDFSKSNVSTKREPPIWTCVEIKPQHGE
ncbi:MAG: hypothetical protein QS748_08455 [Candidatus Endonucleobacter bathymodioli]|uniref:Uncharacterized protein n=1 Tax=Candidatus Endonucleibacter bathymodioli TaxID=539814 RepID=A0AA90NZ20_9GAMM|nr:hypothetical protein [Candidatus Endonucleobacter bathymodioli]